MKMLFLGNHTYINAEHIAFITSHSGPGTLVYYKVSLSTGAAYTVIRGDSGAYQALSDMLQSDEHTLRRDDLVTRLQAVVRLKQMMDEEDGKA